MEKLGLKITGVYGVIVLMVSLFAYQNCAPNQMAGYRVGGLHAPAIPKAKTFEEMEAESDTLVEVNPNTNYSVREVAVVEQTVPQCAIGEMDVLKAAFDCKVNAQVLITIRDFQREQIIYKFGLTSGWSFETMLTQIQTEIARLVAGNEIDIFMCIDHNNNSRCSDEPVLDINALTALIVGNQNAAVCNSLKGGAILFHKHHVFDGAATLAVQTGQAVQVILNNLDSGGPVNTNGRPTFTIKLAIADRNLCPKPVVRTDGCFATGTKIAVSKDIALPIEKLNVGSKVWLADGRYAKIKRVTAGPESKPMMWFKTADNQKIMITDEHPLMTNKGVKLAKDIALGDKLKTAAGQFTGIAAMGQIEYKDKVINFELEGTPADKDHLVIAEGLVTGELFMQNQMAHKTDVKGLAKK